MAKINSVVLLVSVLFATGYGKVAVFSPCNNVPQDLCTVSEIRIDPCVGKNKCMVKTGTNASLSFDFTPNFAASRLNTMAFYEGTPFADMTSSDACGHTTCPTVPGVKQTLDYHLYIGKKLPLGTYAFNWKVWDADNESQQCCFTTTIQLMKNKK